VTDQVETHPHDVLVIGAGGAGLRAAIAARAAGASVGLVCKSLLGKAHTVMAEGGVAAALAHVAPNDSWQVHFRDTIVGGKKLNNPRMAELHAKEAPARVRELEECLVIAAHEAIEMLDHESTGARTYSRLDAAAVRSEGLELDVAKHRPEPSETHGVRDGDTRVAWEYHFIARSQSEGVEASAERDPARLERVRVLRAVPRSECALVLAHRPLAVPPLALPEPASDEGEVVFIHGDADEGVPATGAICVRSIARNSR